MSNEQFHFQQRNNTKHWCNCTIRKKIVIQPGGGGPKVVVSTAAFHARIQGSVPGLDGLKETKYVSSPSTCESQYCACSASDRQGLNFESCVWRAVSSQSSHHPQEVLLAQFSLYLHKGGLKPYSFHFFIQPGSYIHVYIHMQANFKPNENYLYMYLYNLNQNMLIWEI